MGTVRRAIKKDAHAALKGHWGTAVLITLLTLVVSFALGLFEGAVPLMLGAPGFFASLAQSANPWEAALDCAPWFLLFTALMGLLSLIFVTPMAVGTADWYMGRSEGQQQDVSHIFWPFGCKKFWGSMVLFVATYLITLFWEILFLALPVGLIGYGVYSLYYLNLDPLVQTLTITGILAAALFLLVLLFFLAVFLSRYSLAVYLMGKRYAKGPLGALRMSARITKGHCFETFWFGLSFLPWMLLNGLVVPMFYTLPYLQMSFALYTRYLVELEEKARTPMTLPAFGEGPALLDELHAEQPAPEAEAPAPQVDEVVEEVEAEVVEDSAEEPRILEEAIMENNQPEEVPML